MSIPNDLATRQKLAIIESSTVPGQPAVAVVNADGTPITLNAVVSATTEGQFNTTLPTYTDGQTTVLQTDNRGRLIISSINSTVTVSGTVTANAGTNLNTSALALESGGHLASIDSKITAVNTGAVVISSGTVTSNAGTNLNTSALALESGGHLASIDSKITAVNTGAVVISSGTVTANIGTTNGLALDATLTGGTQLAQPYDGTNTIFTSSHPGYVQFGSAQVVNTKTALTANTPNAATVGVSSGQVTASNSSRKGFSCTNTSNNTISLAFSGGTAVLNSGVTLLSGASWAMDEYSFTTGQINAIASAGSSNLSYQEYQ